MRALLKTTDKLRSAHVEDTELFWRNSPAADEAADPELRSHIETAIGQTALFIAAAFEHADVVLSFGELAVTNRPTPVFPPLSTARSAIECFANAYWLLEPRIDPLSRAGRSLSLRRADLKTAVRLGLDEKEERLAYVDAEASRLNLSLVGPRGRRGYGAAIPTRSERVKAILDSTDIYTILSGVSHGDHWAILQVYEEVGRGPSDTALMEKKPSVTWIMAAVMFPFEALARCAWREAEYRGWDRSNLNRTLERTYDEAGFSTKSRFWRPSARTAGNSEPK